MSVSASTVCKCAKCQLAPLRGKRSAMFFMFCVLLTVCVVVFYQWHVIDLFSCIAASLFNILTYLLSAWHTVHLCQKALWRFLLACFFVVMKTHSDNSHLDDLQCIRGFAVMFRMSLLLGCVASITLKELFHFKHILTWKNMLTFFIIKASEHLFVKMAF